MRIIAIYSTDYYRQYSRYLDELISQLFVAKIITEFNYHITLAKITLHITAETNILSLQVAL